MLCLPWPPPCSKPIDIEQRVPQILSIHASRLSCHSNVQMQLPSFPFGCYTIPGNTWLATARRGCDKVPTRPQEGRQRPECRRCQRRSCWAETCVVREMQGRRVPCYALAKTGGRCGAGRRCGRHGRPPAARHAGAVRAPAPGSASIGRRMHGTQFAQFSAEVLQRGAAAVLPQHLPDHWLDALLEEAELLAPEA